MSKKKKKQKKQEKEYRDFILWRLLMLNERIARRKIELFEETQKPEEDQDKSKIERLNVGIVMWSGVYNSLLRAG
jgi:hypothetical protein